MEKTPAEKFERFSDDIRHVMRMANREAKFDLHPEIDTPHVLTALTKEKSGLAGFLLRQQGTTVGAIRRIGRRGIRRRWSLHILAKLPLSERVEAIVQHSINHAISEKYNSVGTGGILLAMLRHDDITVQTLQTLRIDIEKLERHVATSLHKFMQLAPGQELDITPDEPARS